MHEWICQKTDLKLSATWPVDWTLSYLMMSLTLKECNLKKKVYITPTQKKTTTNEHCLLYLNNSNI